jgi:hypothetical protein
MNANAVVACDSTPEEILALHQEGMLSCTFPSPRITCKQRWHMSESVMTLDPRYRASNPIATDWETTRRVLETAQVFWLSTIRADGRPQVMPVVGVWLDGAMHFCTGPGRQKAINLRSSP